MKPMIDSNVWWYGAIPHIVEYSYLGGTPKTVRVESDGRWVEFKIGEKFVDVTDGVLDD